MLRKGKYTVGLCISLQKIAVIETHITSPFSTIIDRLGIVDIPNDAINEDGTLNNQVIGRLIRDLFASNNIKASEVSLTLSVGNNVIMRSLTLPSLPKKEMIEVLRGEVENYAILSSDDPILDYQTISQPSESSGLKVELLLAAVPKAFIRSYIASIETAGLKLSAIEIAPLSILRVLANVGESNYENSIGNRPAMMVSLEEDSGMIIISKAQTVKFIHAIEMGRNQLESDNVYEELANELTSSLIYYNATFPQEEKIEKITLLVNSANSDYICKKLKEYLEIPIVIPPPLELASDTISEIAENNNLLVYAAVGSAIRNRNEESINLLPSKKADTLNIRKYVFTSFLIILSTALLFICADIILKARVKSIINNMISIQQAQKDSGMENLVSLSGIEADVVRLRSQIKMMKSTTDSISRVEWVEVLPEISHIIPKAIWLENVDWKDRSIVVLRGSALSYDSVFRFIDSLSNSSYFSSPKLIFIKKADINNREIVNFEIQSDIKNASLNRQEDKSEVS